ncbi:MAG: DUF488 domain-containing protein [Candidatus Rokubacteria bacterium]|nr:DUF488 domain-containing protein [Candidatus Rokubacteria bacterium]
MRSIYTVGHSTRSAEDLIALLQESSVEAVADVRRWPVSSRSPHFTRAPLETALARAGIAYRYLGAALGGYREGGYAAHLETAEFAGGVATLEELASRHRVAVL